MNENKEINFYTRSRDRLNQIRKEHGLPTSSSRVMPEGLYPYKCTYCGNLLMAEWCERDILNGVSGFYEDRYYDVCLKCEEKLGVVSKLKHSKEPPYCLIPRWGDIDDNIEKTETD